MELGLWGLGLGLGLDNCVILWNVWSQKGFDFANRGVRRSERLVSDPGYGWAISSLSPSTDAVAAGAAGRH